MASARAITRVSAALTVVAAAALAGVTAAGTQSDPAAGRALFDQACASCHGAAGQGERGPSLNSGRFVHGGDDADLARAIRSGIAGSQMPAFARFSDDEVRQLVAYIRVVAAVDEA